MFTYWSALAPAVALSNLYSYACRNKTTSSMCMLINLQYVFSSLSETMSLTIYHQGFFHSVRRNLSLNCLHRHRSLAIPGHAGPKWRIRLSLHLVLGLPCRLVHSFSWCPSVTLFIHLLSLNRTTMYPANPCIPFLITSFTQCYINIVSNYIYIYIYTYYRNEVNKNCM